MKRIALFAVVMLAFCGGAFAQGPAKIPNPTTLPFSPGLRVGDTLYVSGTLGRDAKTGAVPASIDEEARLVLSLVQKTVETAGMSLDDVVSVTVFCTDLAYYDAFNKAYREAFHAPYPARAFIGVNKLIGGAHFEVMGVAVKNATASKK